MRYGIVENHKFVLIDENLKRLKNTLPFMPQYSVDMVETYPDDEVEQGFDGNWYEKGHAPKQPLDEAKAAKLAEINTACDNILNAATATYPASEVLTFDQQTIEAQAYQAENNAKVPLLSALAASRKIPLPELVQRVLAKHDAFSALSGMIIGQRQALEDRLNSCETINEVNAIIVSIEVNNE